MGSLGIDHFSGSHDEYHHLLDIYRFTSRTQRNDEGEFVDGKMIYNWHQELSPALPNFP